MTDRTWDDMPKAPRWARRVDDAAHRAWPKRPPMRRSEIVGNVIGNLISLAIVNLHEIWRPWTAGVVTVEWSKVVFILSMSATVTVVANVLLFVFRSRSLQHIVGLLTAGAGLISTATVLEVFPFAFGQIGLAWIDVVLWIVMLLAVLGITIGIGVRLVRLAFSTLHD